METLTLHIVGMSCGHCVRQVTKALTLLQTTAGIETVSVAEEEVTRLQQVSEQVRQELVGKLYPQESLDRVLALRDAYRRKQQKD